jgi:hypothetical protein
MRAFSGRSSPAATAGEFATGLSYSPAVAVPELLPDKINPVSPYVGSCSARSKARVSLPRSLLGVVEDYAERAAVTCRHATDAVAHVHAIPAAGALHRPVVHREYRGITFCQRQDLWA